MKGLDKRIRVLRNIIESLYISIFLILISSPRPTSLLLSGFSILYSVEKLLLVQEKMEPWASPGIYSLVASVAETISFSLYPNARELVGSA